MLNELDITMPVNWSRMNETVYQGSLSRRYFVVFAEVDQWYNPTRWV